MRVAIAALLAASAVSAPVAVAAAEPNVTIRVSAADLDLTDQRHVEVLQARVERMAREACELRDPLGRAAPRTDWACVHQAKADAMRQVTARQPSTMQVAAGN